MSEKQFNDPYASREQEKYDNPVPSRETILELIAQQQSAMNREQIQHHFQIDDDERQEGMRRRLKAMERDNQLVWVKGYYHHVDDFPLITGIVSAHRDGYGFVFAEDSDDDIFLNQREMQQLFHGDRVNVRIINQDKKGRRGGVVAEIIQRNTHKITGISRRTGERWLIKPEHKYIREEIFIEKEENTPGLEEGQVVVLEIT
ncbi:MAG: ribonuclease R, partial [Fidelibacterota bacterium]